MEGKAMNVTELLVTGYDGDEPLFAVALGPDAAMTVKTGIDGEGEAIVDSVARQSADVFVEMRDMLQDLVVAAPEA